MTTIPSSSIKICPQCGSSAVDFSSLHGGDASCRGCAWKGTSTDLFEVPVPQDGVVWAHTVFNEVRNLFSGELGIPYLKFLLRWGFIEGDPAKIAGTVDRKVFARYLAAIGRAVFVALLETRSALEVERVRAEKAKEPS